MILSWSTVYDCIEIVYQSPLIPKAINEPSHMHINRSPFSYTTIVVLFVVDYLLGCSILNFSCLSGLVVKRTLGIIRHIDTIIGNIDGSFSSSTPVPYPKTLSHNIYPFIIQDFHQICGTAFTPNNM